MHRLNDMLYYYKDRGQEPGFPHDPLAVFAAVSIPMAHHTHHHHHHPGHSHPPAAATVSLLRMSVARRLAVAAGLIVLVWVGVYWAIAS